MLSRRFDELFTRVHLLDVLELYKTDREYEQTKELIVTKRFIESLSDGFIPDPLQGFEIPKNNGEMRQLAKASLTSKIVQKIIADALADSVKFNDKSYAFRKGKGTLKAIHRTSDFLKRYTHIAKADIDDFFDSINQEKLIIILKRIIVDPKITALIALFLKNGMMKHHSWVDRARGVYQGDSLSPVLSNIYLHSFDLLLEKKGIDFVRFADDMVFFARDEKQSHKYLSIASSILSSLDLKFGDDKSYLSSRSKGFEFLGLYFRGKSITMNNDRLMKKLSTISQKTKKRNLEQSIEFVNQYTDGIRRYYAKVLTKMDQLTMIEEHIDSILIQKIIEAKKSKTINKKSKFVQLLSDLKELEYHTREHREQHAHALVARAYEAIALANPLESAAKTIAKKKSNYLQEQIKSSEILLNGFGLYVSMSRGKVVVKEYGKVIKSMPIHWVTRIVVMTKGASISTALILECSRRKIDIDFIEKQTPYAQILYHNTIAHNLHQKQLEFIDTKEGLSIAKSIIRAKMKNQLNLIKYYARYRKDSQEFTKLEQHIATIENIYQKTKSIKKVSSLMGLEGSASVAYWGAFGLLIGEESFKRSTQNAPDAINQSLNYGYAFLYHRMQSALHKTGVNIYYSFLHSTQANKPTLVYDMIEPFRQPTVDREIISVLNRGTKLNSSKGRLTPKSVKVITQNIQERLATPTKWRKGKYRIVTIIDEQALELSHVIQGIKARFQGFVARY
ncbi:MAG: CRISPR-associated endonuclease Cas1 [Campylobacterota bacterium]|nr:CRISPR-associated endonuclease Cas1 [Campylobacterota bacterium]